jgi:hypothetical protein
LAGAGLAWTYYAYPCGYYPYLTQCNM